MAGDGTTRDERLGVIAVIKRHDARLLVIRRSAHVPAPLAYCFPGGAVEHGESEEEALRRELREELALEIFPQQCIWRSVAPWGVRLHWWLARLACDGERPQPAAAEVCEVHWLTVPEILALPQLLSTNREFLLACAARL